MIGAFLDSWALFQTTYLSGWLIAYVLGLVGVWVVARDQIFLGVAVAQASTLGVAIALWSGRLAAVAAFRAVGSEASGSDLLAAGFAVAASVATALLTTRHDTRNGGGGAESGEAVTGWVFLVAASVPTLLLAHDPHGLEEVHQLLFSTLLGATPSDLLGFAGLAAITTALVWRLRDPLLLLAVDPEMAAAVGLRHRLWRAALAVWLGLAVGLSIRVSGTLYTFGCLVLPALVAKHWVREVRSLMVLAPAVAVAAAVAGFVLANHFDIPPAHMTVALLCAALPLSWLRARARRED